MAPDLIFPPVVAQATCYTSAFGLLVVSNAALCGHRVLAPALLTGVGALGVLSSLNSSLTASCSRFEDKQLSVYLGQANYMQEQPLFPRACLGLPTLLSFILFLSFPCPSFRPWGLEDHRAKGAPRALQSHARRLLRGKQAWWGCPCREDEGEHPDSSLLLPAARAAAGTPSSAAPASPLGSTVLK